MYQLEEAIAATDLTLSEEELRRLEEPYVPHPVLGHEVAPDLRRGRGQRR